MLFRRKKQTQQPVESDGTSWSGATWQELYGQETKGRPGVMLEATRRVVKALEASEHSAASLGKRISWLNLWLLVFTIVICALTVVLVLVESRVITGPHEPGTGRTWLLWIEDTYASYVRARAQEKVSWTVLVATTASDDCRRVLAARINEGKTPLSDAEELVEVKGDALLKTLLGKGPGGRTIPIEMHTLRYVCLPDTVDPRGPKGK